MPRARKPKIGDKYASIPTTWDPDVRRIEILRFLPEGAAEPTGIEAVVLTSVRTDRHVMMSLRDLADRYELEGGTT